MIACSLSIYSVIYELELTFPGSLNRMMKVYFFLSVCVDLGWARLFINWVANPKATYLNRPSRLWNLNYKMGLNIRRSYGVELCVVCLWIQTRPGCTPATSCCWLCFFISIYLKLVYCKFFFFQFISIKFNQFCYLSFDVLFNFIAYHFVFLSVTIF